MRKGFTLLELLIGLAIFSLVATGIYSALSMGIRSWRRVEESTERTQELRAVMERISQDLRNAFPSWGIKETLWGPFLGDSSEMTFPTMKLTQNPEDLKKRWQIGMVRYALEGKKLKRWMKIDLQQDSEGSPVWENPEVWAEGISSISFQYAIRQEESLGWKGRWVLSRKEESTPAEIPRMVKVSLDLGAEQVVTQVELPLGALVGEEDLEKE